MAKKGTKSQRGKSIEAKIFSAKVALIQTSLESVAKIVSDPKVVSVGTESFVEGILESPRPGHFDDRKRIVINMKFIVTFTAFESLAEVLGDKNLKLVSDSAGHNKPIQSTH